MVCDCDCRFSPNTGYTLSAQQTEAGLQAKPGKSGNGSKTRTAVTSRVDFYVGHLIESEPNLPEHIRYIVINAYYTKQKWVNGVVQIKRHEIGKLRCDANSSFYIMALTQSVADAVNAMQARSTSRTRIH